MNKSESISELAKALNKAQAALQPAKFNAVNPFLKNRYADLGAVIDAARKPLADNGLSVTQPVSIEDNNVCVDTMLMHVSGEWISSSTIMAIGEERGKSAAQVAGSIITYLRRYSLASMIGIYADEDTDGNQTEHKPTKQAEQPAPAPAQAPARADEIVTELGFTPPAASQTAELTKISPSKPGAMTIGEAMNETAEDGTTYGNMETPALANRMNSMMKVKGTESAKPEHARKMAAIQMILNARKGK